MSFHLTISLTDTHTHTHTNSDAYAMFPTNKGQAVRAACAAFEKVRVKHCTDIQMESETYAKNAYGAPRSLKQEEGGGEGGGGGGEQEKEEKEKETKKEKEERKLGGYRLVKFELKPFKEVYEAKDATTVAAVEKE